MLNKCMVVSSCGDLLNQMASGCVDVVLQVWPDVDAPLMQVMFGYGISIKQVRPCCDATLIQMESCYEAYSNTGGVLLWGYINIGGVLL